MKNIRKTVIIVILAAASVFLYMKFGANGTGDTSSAVLTGTAGETVQAESSDGTETPGTDSEDPETADTGGFTVKQKEELKEIVEEAMKTDLEEMISGAVADSLEKNLNDMIEDGRLGSAVSEYVSVTPNLINVNTADVTELIKLNGIGQAKAEAIIAWRSENGPFTSLEDLTKVSGISTGTLEKFRDQATL